MEIDRENLMENLPKVNKLIAEIMQKFPTMDKDTAVKSEFPGSGDYLTITWRLKLFDRDGKKVIF